MLPGSSFSAVIDLFEMYWPCKDTERRLGACRRMDKELVLPAWGGEVDGVAVKVEMPERWARPEQADLRLATPGFATACELVQERDVQLLERRAGQRNKEVFRKAANVKFERP